MISNELAYTANYNFMLLKSISVQADYSPYRKIRTWILFLLPLSFFTEILLNHAKDVVVLAKSCMRHLFFTL